MLDRVLIRHRRLYFSFEIWSARYLIAGEKRRCLINNKWIIIACCVAFYIGWWNCVWVIVFVCLGKGSWLLLRLDCTRIKSFQKLRNFVVVITSIRIIRLQEGKFCVVGFGFYHQLFERWPIFGYELGSFVSNLFFYEID